MKVVCELSGGADSALAAIYAKKKYPEAEFHCLFVDYDQNYSWEERSASLYLAKRIFGYECAWSCIDISHLYSSEGEETETVASEYFPLRNLIISAIAASLAVKIGAEVIVNGSKSLSRVPTDKYSFRDSTLPFYALMEAAVNGAMEEGRIRIEPLLAMGREQKMSKKQVYRELFEKGIRPEDTWSCYHPVNGKECGECRNCKEKEGVLQYSKYLC